METDLMAPSYSTAIVLDDNSRLQSLDTQIGGHCSKKEKYKDTNLGLFDLKNGLVLKTLLPPPRGPRELKFYQHVFSPDCKDADLVELRSFIPMFHGTEEHANKLMVKLTNLTSPFKKPCIMDLKIGRITYDQEASAQKKHEEDSKFPPIKKTGFQITGMIIQNQTEKQTVDKHYTRSLSEKTVVTHGLDVFFWILNDNQKQQVIQGFITKLKKMESWFLRQKKLSFIASSLLFVYEGFDGSSIESLPLHKNTSISVSIPVAQLPKSSETLESSKLGIPLTPGYRKRLHHDDADNNNHDCATGKMIKLKGDEGGLLKSDISTSVSLTQPHPDTCAPADTCEVIPAFSVHLIDFAHVFPASDTDENFLFGLQNLISALHLLSP